MVEYRKHLLDVAHLAILWRSSTLGKRVCVLSDILDLGRSLWPCAMFLFQDQVQCLSDRETYVPDDVRRQFINDLRPKFSEATYNLFTNNCNNFSDELAQFLTGNGIPVRTQLDLT